MLGRSSVNYVISLPSLEIFANTSVVLLRCRSDQNDYASELRIFVGEARSKVSGEIYLLFDKVFASLYSLLTMHSQKLYYKSFLSFFIRSNFVAFSFSKEVTR